MAELTAALGAPEDEKKALDNADNWVQCDRCGSWRRVGQAVVDSLQDDSTNWFCEDNPDPLHNSCNTKQELTNEEIDQGREGEGLMEMERSRRRRRPAVWQLIRDNIYTHRKQKKLYEDDIMVCVCKPVSAGGTACGDNCLNRMLNLECINGFCTSNRDCLNQRFTRKQYAKVETRRAGVKGFGLFTKTDLVKGQFIVEYVGEVLDEDEYVRRKEYYTTVGQRHYYFMNIGNGEVIDACRRGNRARFINHSCEPNCETQKWVVKGELAIGFFTIKDIPSNSELTFDYNFERYGDKPTKCHCGAPSCRGFIGGSADRYDGTAVDDAAMLGEDLQPIMVGSEAKELHLDTVLDQYVGIGLALRQTRELDCRLRDIAQAQGSNWTVGSDEETEAVQPLAGPNPPVVPEARVYAAPPQMPNPRIKRQREHDADVSMPEGPSHGWEPAEEALTPIAEDPPEDDTHRDSDGDGDGNHSDESGYSAAEEIEDDDWLDSDDRYKERPCQTEAAPIRGKPVKFPQHQPKPKKLSSHTSSVSRNESAATHQRVSSAVPAKMSSGASQHAPSPTLNSSQPASGQREPKAASGSFPTAVHPPHKRRIVKTSRSHIKTPRRSDPGASTSSGGRVRDVRELRDPASTSAAQSETSAVTSVMTTGRLDSAVRSMKRGPPGITRLNRPGMPSSGGDKGRKRSEVERRLDQLVHGKSRMLKKDTIILFVRLFNMCDISPANKEAEDRRATPPHGTNADGDNREVVHRNRTLHNLETDKQLTVRQKARFADLALLLDRVLATQILTLQKELISKGILSRLMWCVGHNYGLGYAPILRKICRVVEHLPFTVDQMHTRISGAGCFADVLTRLATNVDVQVKQRANQLLTRFKAPVVARPPRPERSHFSGGNSGTGGTTGRGGSTHIASAAPPRVSDASGFESRRGGHATTTANLNPEYEPALPTMSPAPPPVGVSTTSSSYPGHSHGVDHMHAGLGEPGFYSTPYSSVPRFEACGAAWQVSHPMSHCDYRGVGIVPDAPQWDDGTAVIHDGSAIVYDDPYASTGWGDCDINPPLPIDLPGDMLEVPPGGGAEVTSALMAGECMNAYADSRPAWVAACAAQAGDIFLSSPKRFEAAPISEEVCGERTDLIDGLLLGIYGGVRLTAPV